MAQIDKLDLSDPVHAKCDNPEFDVRDMIGIDIGRCQSASMEDIKLGVDISCDAIEINIAGQPFEVSLAAATLKLDYHNAEVQQGSKYRKILRSGSIEASQSTREHSIVARDLSLEGGVGIQASPKINALARFRNDKKQERESQRRVEEEIALVQSAGQDSWKLGGSDGNPLLVTRDLRGPIISSVGADEAMTPLCGLSARDATAAVTGRISILASVTDFRLTAKDQPLIRKVPPQPAYDSLKEGLHADKKHMARRADKAALDLKQRVAALAMVMPARRQSSSALIPLAEREFVFLPVGPQSGGVE